MLLSTLRLDAQVPMQQLRGLTRAQIDSVVHPTVSPEAVKMVQLDVASHELGTLQEDDAPVNRTFTLRNVSKRPISIARVRTTCGCTVAEYDSLYIAPNATTPITLTYNPKNRPGTIDVDAFVYIKGYDRQPMARLSLYGEVIDSDEWSHLPQTMGMLRLKRKEVRFAELPAKGKTAMCILCANSGQKPLRLTSRILPPYASLHTEPAVIAPGKEADLVVTIDVDKLPANDGAVRSSLIIEGVSGKPSERTLQLIIEQ